MISKVLIRPITLEDTQNIVKWRNSPMVRNNLYTQDRLTTEQHIDYYHRFIESRKVIQFIISVAENSTNIDIGTTFIKNIDIKSQKAEFGIFIGEDKTRGKGYGTQATKLTVDYAFNELQLNRVYLTVIADNNAAINAYKKCGFKLEGIMKQDFLRNGAFVDVAIMGMIRKDWEGDSNGKIKVTKAPVEGLYIIEPTVFGDNRGYFMETYNQKDMAEAGLDMTFVQDNQSMSKKGVLRGLHYQINYPQGKLVRVIKGKVFDVAVDLRRDSPTYLQWYGVELSEENKKQFYISPGFAHGFLVLSDVAEFCYKCTDFYHPEDEGGIAWNDPKVGVVRPDVIGEYKGSGSSEGYTLKDGTELTISDKDQNRAPLD